MNRLNTDSLLRRFKERAGVTAALSLSDFRQITPTLAKVVITYANCDRLSKSEIRAEIAHLFNNRASAVEGSFRALRTTSLPAAVGFVRINRESKPYVQKEVAGMRVLAANMLMDEQDDSLWNVRTTTDGTRLLCRQVKEDISELLETAAVHVHRAPELSHVQSYALPGDMVLFVNPQTERVTAGIVVDMESAQRPQTVDVPEGSETLTIMEVPVNGSDEMRGVDMPIAERLSEEVGGETDMRYKDGLLLTPAAENLNGSDELRTDGMPIEERLHDVHSSLLVAAATSKEVQEAASKDAPTNAASRAALTAYWKQVWGPISKEYDSLFDKIIDTTFA